jgi:hypothetical protein
VAVAVLGTQAPSRPSPAPPAPSVAQVAATPAVAVSDPRPVLDIAAPSVVGAVITTPRLHVRGSRVGPSGPVRVTLESSGAKLIESETIPASGAGGAFEVAFPLSNPRPGGSMVVQVVAFDPHGIPLEVVRIPIEIGAIAEGAPRTVGRTGAGPLGEDGIVGGIVFGNAWDPEALADSTP